MTKRGRWQRPAGVAEQRRLEIEQAIARGERVSFLMTRLGISYETYREVRDELDELIA